MKRNNYQLIERLIDAFYKGETDVEQEQVLLRYFEGEDVDEKLQDEKYVFLRMYHAENIEIPVHLKSNLNSLINRLSENEKKANLNRNNKLWSWMSRAACIALLISGGLFLYLNNKTNKSMNANREAHLKDTFSDPKKAQVEVEKALTMVSTKFNRGIDKFSIVSSKIEKTNKILDKTFKHS